MIATARASEQGTMLPMTMGLVFVAFAVVALAFFTFVAPRHHGTVVQIRTCNRTVDSDYTARAATRGNECTLYGSRDGFNDHRFVHLLRHHRSYRHRSHTLLP